MYKIGLDIGTTSVGHSIIECDNLGTPIRLIDFGVRIFDAAENPKDGSLLAQPRRDARGARRRNRRHRHRIERIKSLLVSQNLVTRQQLADLYSKPVSDIYEIRYNALEKRLEKEDFARLLIHLAQRRGFKSNRKSAPNEKEEGLLLTAVSKNRQLMEQKNYRTIGEMIFKDEQFAENKRNKQSDYSNTFDRAILVDEVKCIFKMQAEFANSFATSEFETDYLKIYESQRSFEEGPGGESPYGGNQIEKMIGKCTFEIGEPRAVKASYTFSYCILLQKINTIGILCDGEKRELTDFERGQIVSLAFKSDNISFARIRKELSLSDSETFSGISYGRKEIAEVETKEKIKCMQSYHEIRKLLDKTVSKGYINNLSTDIIDQIGWIFTVKKNDEAIKKELDKLDIDDVVRQALFDLPAFKNVGHLSITALKKIIPFLEQGDKYNQACENAGYNFKGHNKNKNQLLPPLPQDTYEITSPVVKRAVSQSIKVVNSIIKRFGKPAAINIELAREMSKNFAERNDIKNMQKANADNNEKVVSKLKSEHNIPIPKGQDIIKYKLWCEQDGICLYTGEKLEIEHLFENGYAEIDHIIPYSISFDDSFTNKVLVKAKANRDKGNRLPMQYVQNPDSFTILVKSIIKNFTKQNKLLKKKLSDEERRELKERSLNDTKHISGFMLNYINDNLEFDPSYTNKKRVVAVNGSVTAYMRKRWGITKVREDGDSHHAVDAIVVACISDGTIQKVSRYYNLLETNIKDEDFNTRHFPAPYPNFRKDIECRLSENPVLMLQQENLSNYENIIIENIRPLFVSRMCRKKTTGSAHKETIRSLKEEDGTQYTVIKTSIDKLKLDKNNEIANYYNKESDIHLYNLLKTRLVAHGGDAAKAFKEPVYKPTASGKKAPIVKSVKTTAPTTLNVEVNQGAADNGSMVRIDLFKVEGEGYYMVPIYVSDMVKDVLPNKAIVAGRNYCDWKEMQEDNFLFSIYPNDLIKVTAKKPISFKLNFEDSTLPKEKLANECLVYYKKTGISSGTITVTNHDNTYIVASMGVKTLLNIEKYTVDVLGNYQKSNHKEKREK